MRYCTSWACQSTQPASGVELYPILFSTCPWSSLCSWGPAETSLVGEWMWLCCLFPLQSLNRTPLPSAQPLHPVSPSALSWMQPGKWGKRARFPSLQGQLCVSALLPLCTALRAELMGLSFPIITQREEAQQREADRDRAGSTQADTRVSWPGTFPEARPGGSKVRCSSFLSGILPTPALVTLWGVASSQSPAVSSSPGLATGPARGDSFSRKGQSRSLWALPAPEVWS